MTDIIIGPSFRLFEQQEQIPEKDREEVSRILNELTNRAPVEGRLSLFQAIQKINEFVNPYGFNCMLQAQKGHFVIYFGGLKPVEAPKPITETETVTKELEDYPYHLEIIVEGTTCDIYLILQDLPMTHFYRASGVRLEAIKELESMGLEYYRKYYQKKFVSTSRLNSVMVGRETDLKHVRKLLSKKYGMRKV